MSQENKKKIITISILAVILLALILVYVFVVIPLTRQETPDPVEPPFVAEGEGLYNNSMVTIYPQLDKSAIDYLEITNKHGTYAFHKYYDSTMEAEEMRLKSFEGIDYDESLYALLTSYIYLPVSYGSNLAEHAPMRDVTKEQMAQMGVTRETAAASYTVRFTENGEKKQYTVYIGHPTLTDETTYYASLEGRNTIYRLHQEGVETCFFASMLDYLSPLIYGKFKNGTEAMVNIERFKIGYSNLEESIESLIEVVKTGQNADGTSNIYDLLYKSRGTGNIVRTSAGATNLASVFTALFVRFSGDSVVCVKPTDEQLKEYGLGTNDNCYYITAQLSSDKDDTCTFRISDLRDGYYYTLSGIYSTEYPTVVRVPKEALFFLGTDDKTIFSFSGTDVSSLFYEYLLPNNDAKEPGMKEISVKIQKRNEKTGEIVYSTKETFKISMDAYENALAECSNGKIYKTINGENEFSDFYTLLIYFPNPTEFNNLTAKEIEDLRLDNSALIFELITQDNDGELLRYSYYQIGTGMDVMIETCKGKIENGEEVWELPQISFNTYLGQMDILRNEYQKLLNGENIRPEDYIY